MDPTSLDDAKELLYGLPLKSFVAERDFLVKQIWAAGNRDLANEVKTLRKPSMVAAEVNHIVRADPEGVDLILQAATLLRAAQTGALEGSTIDASELQQQYRAAIRGLSQSAPTRRAEVRAALEAATIDEASQDDLRSGCLVVVPTTVSVFGTAPPSPAIAPTSATEEPSPPVDELEARRVRRRASNDKDQPQADEEGAAEQAAAEKEAATAEKRRAAEAEAEAEPPSGTERYGLVGMDVMFASEPPSEMPVGGIARQESDGLNAHETLADGGGADTAREQAALEQALAVVQVQRATAEKARANAETAKANAHERAEQAEAKVDALAQIIAAFEID
ncbi:MAG TPA: hypothetical protein DCY82_07435 [Acidimicrobiaceae bacterium]|nr:hypothetical protein [Acidimicrobiaceae bacterium]